MRDWPQSLRLAVDICLNSRFPMRIWWGTQLIFIYNDAYAPILGKRHPEALGRSAPVVWPDAWPVIRPQVEGVMQRGEASWVERIHLILERNGFPEDAWFNWSYSPIRDDAGQVGGLLCVANEVTNQVLAERERDRLQAERERLARAVEGEKANLAGIIEKAPAFICTFRGPDHTFELSNERYYELIGRRDIIGKTVREALPEIAGQGYFELLDHVYRTGEPYIGNESAVQLQRKGGDTLEQRFVNFVYQALRGADGTVTGIFVHGVDVTEIVKSREALRQSEERYRSIIDQSVAGIAETDAEGRYLIVNNRFCEITGYPRAALMQLRMNEITHPDDLQRNLELLKEAAESGQPFQIEKRYVRQDGSVVWVNNNVSVVRGTQSPAGFIAVSIDVSSRKLAEAAKENLLAALERSEATFRQLADAMPQIVWAAKPDGTLDYYNQRWFEYIKLAPELIDEARWDLYIHPDDLQRAHASWSQSVRSGSPYGIEFRVRQADGAYRWFLVRALPIRNDGGNITRWFGTCTDIEEQKALEAQRENLLQSERAARSELERANNVKDEFLATLSHEMRTPLNAILGWSHIMRKSKAPEDLVEGLDIIERNARAQSQIIEDLLDMSRIISGKVRLDVQRLNLSSIVRAAVDTARPTADAKGIRLQAIIDPLHGVTVSGDANRLQQVMWNLLSNAMKFTPREGRVQVLLERVNSHLEISVSDTGEGIRQEFLPFVFDRFRQADASTTRRHGGLGLGLAIVKQLVELHGGSVRVKSAGEGKGSTFIVALPLSVVHPQPEPESERRHPRAVPGFTGIPDNCVEITGVRVLVVDDEPDARALVKRLLEDCHALVTAAASVSEAIEFVQAGEFDVLVSDIGMPGEDGYALIKKVRALAPGRGGKIPAIALTAYARGEDRVKAIAAGFQLHVTKPVEPVELVTMVASAARRIG